MCGIFFYLGEQYSLNRLMSEFMKTSHRGPDSSFLRSLETDNIRAFMGFHRLAIVDMSREGDQPFESNTRNLTASASNKLVESNSRNFAMCNGEIYNHLVIRRKLKTPIHSKSDCAVLLPLYEKVGIDKMMKYLDGDFAFVIVDKEQKLVHLGRDPMGVKPLFYSITKKGEFICCSEMKSIIGLLGENDKIRMLPSGTTLTYNITTKEISSNRYWNPRFPLESSLTIDNRSETTIQQFIHDKLVLAVKKRLMTDRPLGLLISGGLDSSLIAGITKKLLPENTRIKSFSIGMPGSPDVEKAKVVADYLGTEHYTVEFSIEKGIAAIRDVIRQLETYDITTIRASTPQYLLSKYIYENTDVRVVLSGEGSDELFGGYLYSHLAPSNDELQKDSERLMKELEVYDVLRTDRTTAGNGLEVRVPFLDRGFIKYVAGISGKWKNPNESSGMGKRIEKKLLRDSFNDDTIPNEILYRIKNAFSDACGYDWIPSLRQYCESLVSDEDFSNRSVKYPHCTPPTKEAYFYRTVFEEYYPNQSHILEHYWLPNWIENNGEPSAKVLNLVE